jgi:uridine kinase
MESINVTLNGGIKKEYSPGVTYYEISKDVNLEHSILAVKINNQVNSLYGIAHDGEVLDFITVMDLNGYNIYKAGLKMIFELALKRRFPKLEITYNHSVPRGMLGTVLGDDELTNDDLTQIKGEMAKIIGDNLSYKKLNVRKKDAIFFCDKTRQFEKANNIRCVSDDSVTLYQLDNLINYYYSEMPYSTGAISKFELVYLGNNKIVFLFPNSRSNGMVPEYVHYENIINSFYEGQEWLKNLQMPYVTDLNQIVGNGKIKDFINSNEIMFNISICNAAQTIIKKGNVKFVLIAGPSSSGKTTSNKRLASYLAALGYDPIKISIDDYFVERDKTPKDAEGNYDYECLGAIDTELLNQNVTDLLNHKEVKIPTFNFITGKREFNQNLIRMKENSIFMIEGLHALNDELLPSIDDNLKYKIYLSPFIPLNIDRHNYISTIDLRLLRRIVRDNRTRGYGVATTINSWQVVRNGEEKNIFPYIHQADTIINTALAYEVGVLKVYVEPLLYSVGIDSPYYAEAERLIKFLKQFFPIPGEYVNKDSILREFIGGNDND